MRGGVRIKVLKASDLEAIIQSDVKSRSAANQIIEDAREQAIEILDDAYEAAREQHQLLGELSEDTLKSFIDEDRIKRHAETFVDLLKTIEDIKKTNEVVAPWFTCAVREALHAIMGEMDDSERIGRVVAKSMTDLNKKQETTIRCAVADLVELRKAAADRPDLFSGVTNYIADPALGDGKIFLDCKSGSIEITISTQVDALCTAVHETLNSTTVYEEMV